jgi:hypothetical protein
MQCRAGLPLPAHVAYVSKHTRWGTKYKNGFTSGEHRTNALWTSQVLQPLSLGLDLLLSVVAQAVTHFLVGTMRQSQYSYIYPF